MTRIGRQIARLVCLFVLLMPVSLAAASFPAHGNLYVNDYAGLLDADTRARLVARLETLRADSGVEMTILTLNGWQGLADPGQGFADFATALFNDWGVGASNRNDGILVLVAPDSRDMRIVLGDGYDRGFSDRAAALIADDFLPAFAKGDYPTGIEAGAGAVIDQIALPHSVGQPPPARHVPLIERLFPWIFGAVAALIVGMGIFGRLVGDYSFRFRRCPECGQVGMHRAHVTGQARPDGTVDVAAAAPLPGQTGMIVTRCLHCSYHDERPWVSPGRSGSSSSGGGSFGGGHSSGGGASGKW